MPGRFWHQVRQPGLARASGVTLLELLVVVTIISVLASVVLATLGRVRATSRSFVCKNNLKTIAFEFIQFADDFAHPWRGDSERFGRSGFRIEDFQEKLYRIDEFWDGPHSGQTAYEASAEPMICPAGPRELERSSGQPCSERAVGPVRNVSIGFNMRLDRASVQFRSRWVLQPIRLTHRILDHPSVPLAFDLDGAAADERGVLPYYSAPAAGDGGMYAGGAFWFPASRHANKLNAAFVGGHVLSSREPENQPGWDWQYQHPPD